MAVALIITSRRLGSIWSVIYKIVVGAIAGGICFLVMGKMDTSDEVRWVSSFVIGVLVSLAATAIPWN